MSGGALPSAFCPFTDFPEKEGAVIMQPETLWERIKQGLRGQASAAVEKAEYLGKLGRARLDIAETRSAIQSAFAELGGLVYHEIGRGETALAQQAGVQEQVQKIRKLETLLKEREARLQALRAGEAAEGAGVEKAE